MSRYAENASNIRPTTCYVTFLRDKLRDLVARISAALVMRHDLFPVDKPLFMLRYIFIYQEVPENLFWWQVGKRLIPSSCILPI